jgi:hypothetical protein
MRWLFDSFEHFVDSFCVLLSLPLARQALCSLMGFLGDSWASINFGPMHVSTNWKANLAQQGISPQSTALRYSSSKLCSMFSYWTFVMGVRHVARILSMSGAD